MIAGPRKPRLSSMKREPTARGFRLRSISSTARSRVSVVTRRRPKERWRQCRRSYASYVHSWRRLKMTSPPCRHR